MMYISIHNLVGIKIDDSYPWMDTLSIAKWAEQVDEIGLKNCDAIIEIKKCEKLPIEDCRDIGDGLLISHKSFIDTNFGVRLDRNASNHITLQVTQECNEWLNMSLQLLLIELDATLIHAAALEKEGEVLLLPSWGGVGKTASVVRMVNEEGWKLLGDDLVILKNGEILPYLKPFVIYPYHKPLFPGVFKENKGRVISSLKVNQWMGKSIPTVKRMLRPVPKLLSLARKYNPQSMRVNPKDIFAPSQLSLGGTLQEVIWLERIPSNNKDASLLERSVEKLASKTTSVTTMEIFSERLKCLYAMHGAGIFDFHETQIKMYNLIKSSFFNTKCMELEIPTSVPIKDVGKVVMSNIVEIRKNVAVHVAK